MNFVDNDFSSFVFIVICSVFVFFVIKGNKRLQFKNLILFGFVLRIFLMLTDYYHWFHILHSGADTEAFNWIALRNQTLSVWKVHTNYSYFLTLLYKITNSSRLIAQYINVLFGLGVMVYVQRSLSSLKINKNIQKKAMLVVVLLPDLIIFSGILLREAWIEFFVAASLFYFIRWFKNGSSINLLLSVFMVLLAAVMHSGVIGLLMGYVIAFLTYNPKKQKVHFSVSAIVSLILLSGIMILLMNYSGMFTSKFAKYDFDDPEAFVELTNKTGRGNSAYLTWIKADNVTQSLLFIPLKMFYFLFSPLPTEWRGINDIIGFCIDGLVYLWLCICIYRLSHLRGLEKSLKRFLLISLLITVFIYAYGTSNAGTSMRHRAKIMPLIILTYAISMNYSTNIHRKIIKY